MEWLEQADLVDYEAALATMEARADAVRAGSAEELVWLLEHPPLYTAGTSAQDRDLLPHGRFPVYRTGRGGQYTYHGPGQRVAYLMLDLKKRQKEPDIKLYIWQLEEMIIRALATFGIQGGRREGRVGIWVDLPSGTEAKIAAIGVRIRRWVTMHGVAVNINPDLSHYAGIIPCGISEYGVTSMAMLLGRDVEMTEFDEALKKAAAEIFES